MRVFLLKHLQKCLLIGYLPALTALSARWSARSSDSLIFLWIGYYSGSVLGLATTVHGQNCPLSAVLALSSDKLLYLCRLIVYNSVRALIFDWLWQLLFYPVIGCTVIVSSPLLARSPQIVCHCFSSSPSPPPPLPW